MHYRPKHSLVRTVGLKHVNSKRWNAKYFHETA